MAKKLIANNNYIIKYGFAIFIMFFGSGNLVFPIQIGFISKDSWILGFLGLLITGIILPLLGLMVIKVYQGDYKKFFGQAGKLSELILPLFILSLLGSFAVIPRCIAVSFGGVKYLYPEVNLAFFSFIFCFVTYLLCLEENLMVKILGKWLSPILLSILIFLILSGSYQNKLIFSDQTNFMAVADGFLIGYQTMDLFGAFFFSALIFKQLKPILPKNASNSEIVKFAVKPSLFAAFLLGIVYFGLVYLGSSYREIIQNKSPEIYLPTIATHVIGSYASLFIALVIILSCITTAVALNNIYANYLVEFFKLKPKRFNFILLITTMLSFCFSLLDFNGIASILVPMLKVTYPSIIALTILCLITRKYKTVKTLIFYVVTIIMIFKNYIL